MSRSVQHCLEINLGLKAVTQQSMQCCRIAIRGTKLNETVESREVS